MMFDLAPEPVVVDRSSQGIRVKLYSTTDPRRAHLEGLTGVIECQALGVMHVRWENGEHFALTLGDEWAVLQPASPLDGWHIDVVFECPVCLTNS